MLPKNGIDAISRPWHSAVAPPSAPKSGVRLTESR
jgi:hypothetical protein